MNSKVNEKCWYVPVCSEVGKNCEYCSKYAEMKFLMEHSWLPKSKQKPMPALKPDTDNDAEMFEQLDDIRMNIRDFVKSGRNLYIGSSCTGNGKTTWAIKLLHKYFERIWDCNCYRVRGLFVHVPTLLLRLKNFNDPMSAQEYALLKECDLIIWDDIAAGDLSNYDYGQLLAIIDYRLLAEKSNIYTSNIATEKELVEVLGNRLASRVYKSSKVIIFDGKDNRTDG